MRPLHSGLLAAAGAFVLDQAFKVWMLDVFAIENHGAVHVSPFLEITLAWNRGISYSLLTAQTDVARLGLLGIYVLACIAFFYWMVRASNSITTIALGLLIGGASGNALDRARFGAVADFFLVHFGHFAPWGVFNVADMAIVAGVGLLMYESFLKKDQA